MLLFYNMEDIIKNTKFPVLLLYVLLLKNDDEECCNILKYFLKYHLEIYLKLNMSKLIKLLKEKDSSIKLLKNFNKLLINQINLLNKIKKIKNKFNKNRFWYKNVNKQIEYLVDLDNKFKSIFECNKNLNFFHYRLEYIKKETDIMFFTNELYFRLSKVYKLFGYSFFKNHKILITTELDFFDLDYVNKVNYVSYIFFKIEYYLSRYIYLFKLYKYNQHDIELFLSDVKPLDIIPDNFDSEIDYQEII
tara:strand:+ start:190 stop:933 length:744 start_codon:yes stop_codon:yes gene_type:complete